MRTFPFLPLFLTKRLEKGGEQLLPTILMRDSIPRGTSRHRSRSRIRRTVRARYEEGNPAVQCVWFLLRRPLCMAQILGARKCDLWQGHPSVRIDKNPSLVIPSPSTVGPNTKASPNQISTQKAVCWPISAVKFDMSRRRSRSVKLWWVRRASS